VEHALLAKSQGRQLPRFAEKPLGEKKSGSTDWLPAGVSTCAEQVGLFTPPRQTKKPFRLATEWLLVCCVFF
jgi:hypothetical protein